MASLRHTFHTSMSRGLHSREASRVFKERFPVHGPGADRGKETQIPLLMTIFHLKAAKAKGQRSPEGVITGTVRTGWLTIWSEVLVRDEKPHPAKGRRDGAPANMRHQSWLNRGRIDVGGTRLVSPQRLNIYQGNCGPRAVSAPRCRAGR